MTDTPRTQAELLTDFADNQNHGITAQDMRNFVVSVMPPTTVMQTTVTKAAGITLGTSQQPLQFAGITSPDFEFVTDPDSIIGGSSHVASYVGQTFPANTWVDLPAGNYLATIYLYFDEAATGVIGTAALLIDNRITDSGFDPMFGDPNYALEQWLSRYGVGLGESPVDSGVKSVNWTHLLRSLPGNAPTRWGFVTANMSGSPMTVTYVSVQITPIGAAADA